MFEYYNKASFYLVQLPQHRPLSSGEEALQDHLIMEAIYRSARVGKPVELDKSTNLDQFSGTEPKKES